MSNYNFLKSGSGNDRNLSNDDLEKIQSLIFLFAENALKLASTYVEHANRTIVQKKDISNCMKVEAMTFCKKQNTIQLADKLLQDLKNNDNDDEEPFTLSVCNCSLCVIIKHLNEFWTNWKPETPIELSLKKNIDNFDIL